MCGRRWTGKSPAAGDELSGSETDAQLHPVCRLGMSIAVCIFSLLLIATVLVDGFIAMVLPRRVNRRWRPTRIFYRCAWAPWAAIGRRIRSDRRRGAFPRGFGPLLASACSDWGLSSRSAVLVFS